MYFEGSEKKFELIVDAGYPSLRGLTALWYRVVDCAGAQVLSVIRDENCDAYLLSESSLFVFDRKVVMITCGTTTLIEAITALLEVVPVDSVELFTFERKSEKVPRIQPTRFESDVKRLNAIIPGAVRRFTAGQEHLSIFFRDTGFKPSSDDATLEILMHGLCDRQRKLFYSHGSNQRDIMTLSGIASVVEGLKVDMHLFEPFGFSLNAIGRGKYLTVHVTPQDGCSYASIETNINDDAMVTRLMALALDGFAPDKCLVVVFDRGRRVHIDRPDYRCEVLNRHPFGQGFEIGFYDIERRAVGDMTK